MQESSAKTIPYREYPRELHDTFSPRWHFEFETKFSTPSENKPMQNILYYLHLSVSAGAVIFCGTVILEKGRFWRKEPICLNSIK